MIKGTINLQNETLLLCTRRRALPANHGIEPSQGRQGNDSIRRVSLSVLGSPCPRVSPSPHLRVIGFMGRPTFLWMKPKVLNN